MEREVTMKNNYTVRDISEMLGVSTTCVRDWLYAGKLQCHKTDDRHVYVSKGALDAFLDKHPKYKARHAKKNEHDLYIEEKLQVLEELHIYPTGSQIKYMKTLETDVQIDNFAHDLILGKAKVQ